MRDSPWELGDVTSKDDKVGLPLNGGLSLTLSLLLMFVSRGTFPKPSPPMVTLGSSAWAIGEALRLVLWGAPELMKGRRQQHQRQQLPCSVPRASALAEDTCISARVPEYFGVLCPCSAGSVPEPSFPLYLDMLAPYVNQVNLIRAGVPRIVSSSFILLLSPIQRLHWQQPGSLGCLRVF